MGNNANDLLYASHIMRNNDDDNRVVVAVVRCVPNIAINYGVINASVQNVLIV